jgi:hypothetical protein
MPKQRKILQTTLKPTNNDNAWITIGRSKRNVQPKESEQVSQVNKKTDIKSTPPRPIEHSTPLQTPLPASPQSLDDKNSAAELQLTAAINALNSSKNSVPLTKMEFPDPPPQNTKAIATASIIFETNTSSVHTTESDIIMTELNSADEKDTKPVSFTTSSDDKSDKSCKANSKEEKKFLLSC